MKLGFPYLLFYTDSKPEGFAGVTNGPIVRIGKDYKDDEGLLRHELRHVTHWWLTLSLSSILYQISKKYRLWSEVNCFKVQLKYPPANGEQAYREIYAGFIAEKYGLSITKEEALELLK